MKFIKYWLPVILWMTFIFYFSTRQRVQVSDEYVLNFLFFKTLHVIEYFILFGLVYRAVVRELRGRVDRSVFIYALVITFIYACTDEAHQAFIPTRTPAFRDVIIDGIGAIFSWIAIRKLLPKAPPKLRQLASSLGIPA